jgi:hypothetical protein
MRRLAFDVAFPRTGDSNVQPRRDDFDLCCVLGDHLAVLFLDDE